MKKLLIARNEECSKFEMYYYTLEQKNNDRKKYWYKGDRKSNNEENIITNIIDEKNNNISKIYSTTDNSNIDKLSDNDFVPVRVIVLNEGKNNESKNIKSISNSTKEDNILNLDVTIK